ncbi:hypothetical protein KCU59_g7320, partial [Aureobasidium melanogenum]
MRQQINKFVVQVGVKVRWMLVTLIAPELLCGVAAEEWLTACKAARFTAERAKDDGIDWASSHGFFAQMGGFRLRFRNLEAQESRRTSINEPSLEQHSIAAPSQEPLLGRLSFPHANCWNHISETSPNVESQRGLLSKPVDVAVREKSFKSVSWDLAIMSKQHDALSASFGPVDWSPDIRNGALIEQMMYQHQSDPKAGDVALTAMGMTTDMWTLSLEQIQLARKYGIIKTFPNMKKEDLDAISNSDGLAKALAVCQVLWLIIQMISRAASSLAVCQLEVATGAFAITTFLTYMFLWQKPQGVSRPIYLEAVRRPTVAESWELAQCGLEETSSLLYRARSWRQSREHLKARAFSNTIMLICATTLGAVHCAAWNFEFPGRVEMWAWRGCALGSTILPLFLLVWHELYLRFAFTKHMVFSIVVLVGFMLYGFTRLFIMVEMVRCLFFLPVEAFVTTWTINLPGIS